MMAPVLERWFLVVAVALALVAGLSLAGCGGDSAPPLVPAELSPQGTIGVTEDGVLLLLAADGSGWRRVEFDGAWAGEAALSPDGRKVAFDTIPRIWVARLRTGRALPVPGLPPALERPSFGARWSPDGRALVFTGERGIYRSDLSDPGKARLLYADPRALDPDWSGSGDQIAFVRAFSERRGRGRIWIMGARGESPHFVVAGADPALSPDGRQLAYRGRGGVFVLALAGGHVRLLARGAYQPVWSPDGRFIALKRRTETCSEVGCKERIWIIPAQGGRIRPLEPELYDSGDLSWTRSRLPAGTVRIELEGE
jgi:Tol biopolymer transport system component